MENSIKNTLFQLLTAGTFFCLPLLGGCQKAELPDEVNTVEEARRVIVGEWEWERTEINYRGQGNTIYETPDTENKTIQYVFRKDGTAAKIENGKDSIDYNFEIEESLESSDFHLTLSPKDINIQVSRTFLILYNGNLILTNRLGVSSYYIRKAKQL
ncbi:hypothetical protein SAMN05660226_00558 [Parapedobacter luteus]|uniref:Lipocalin-like domain-containing protein n=1 Tax=Parapedobacter luteus TaxID=623280 RepID=A0A1T5A3S5_9SPHI|nr:hypothetical protein [Parapedobacter luteus]SKB29652.1 hypothetical protein SAMN05660226_00558 [Parapedobacter luteus]